MGVITTLTVFVDGTTRIVSSWLNAVDGALAGPTHFNVRAYGALADGVTSDSVAIMAAITAANAAGGGIVYFPAGTYLIGSSLTPTSSRLVLQGAGRGRTILKKGFDGTLINWTGSSAYSGVRDMTLDAQKATYTTTNPAILFVTSTYTTVENVEIKNSAGRAIYLYQGSNCKVINCVITATGVSNDTTSVQSGIYLHQCTLTDVSGNVVDGCTGFGITLGGAGNNSDIVIRGNIVRNCYYIGIALASWNNRIAVTGNTVQRIDGNAIDTGACYGVTVSGNTMEDCESGIVSDNGYDHTYTGNVLRNMVGPAIYGAAAYVSGGVAIGCSGVDGAGGRFVVTGNLINGCAGDGISLINATDSVVVGNSIANAGKALATKSGIILFASAGSPCKRNVVGQNRIHDDQGTATMAYGLRAFGASADLANNLFVQNSIGTVLTATTNFGGGSSRSTAGTWIEPTAALVSADVGDAAKTLTVGTSELTQRWATTLTADRAVTLSTTSAVNGAKFRIVRTAAATGAFNLNVGTGPLKALTAGQWAEVEYNGAAWMLTAAGSL